RMSFGRTLSEARRKAGLSQRELAARILKEDGEPISPQYLNDLERDRRNPPARYLLKQFADVLQLPEDYLDFMAGPPPEAMRSGSSTSSFIISSGGFLRLRSRWMRGWRWTCRRGATAATGWAPRPIGWSGRRTTPPRRCCFPRRASGHWCPIPCGSAPPCQCC